MNPLHQQLMEELTSQSHVVLPFFGGIALPDSVVISWAIMALIMVLVLLATRRLSLVPGFLQNGAEAFVSFMDQFCTDSLGSRGLRFAPCFGALALFLVLANTAGLVYLPPPTKDLNVTLGLALTAEALIYGTSFSERGFKGGLRRFTEPMVLLTPMNLLEVITRPLSLCMRLFGNILGGAIIMTLIRASAPLLIPLPLSLYFDLFDGVIQAVVFLFLTAAYLKETAD